MKVVRVALGVAVATLLVLTRPGLSAGTGAAPSDGDATYLLRVEKGKSHRIRFHMVSPRGDSLIEADQFDFVLSRKGLVIRPSSPTTASSLSGARLTFDAFELVLPTDGSPQVMDGTLSK